MNKPQERASASIPRVVVATTAMLSFISYWRASAIVLADLGSSAYYAGGEAERAVGKAAPWFILAVMLFSYAVRAIYIESCSMFVRGGVYRVVKEALGGTLAKFSVSALMFDYCLTGPISAVSARQYLVGLLNELLARTHARLLLPENATAATFAVLVTVYFWWQNVKGIPESSEKALRIMQVTTVMVVLLIGWCVYTVLVRGAPLPISPRPQNLRFAPPALGWLQGTSLPQSIGLIAVLIALGHSVLAMSGEESLAQVYREIEHPKLPNLKKTGFIIFLYSLLFTSLVSIFAVMIIPDQARPSYFGNLIGGLAMFLQGPLFLRLAFRAFVVIVGVLILSAAVNTAIVGSNGVLNRVSEDGVLADWFRHPHNRFGTSHRIINLIVGLQLLTILVSQGNVTFLASLYAFGVIWSFAMKGVSVLVLRYKHPEGREYRVPLNVKVGRREIPIGLGLVTLVLLGIAVINLFTKPDATVSGIIFSTVLFTVFSVSERLGHKRTAIPVELDQFHLAEAERLSPELVGCQLGNVLVLAKNYRALYPLDTVLKDVDTRQQDVVLLYIRILSRAGSGEHGLVPEQLVGSYEQQLFTSALSIAERHGKTIHLALLPANQIWDGMVQAAQSLQASRIVVGSSALMSAREQARRSNIAWERLPEPKRAVTLEVVVTPNQRERFFVGPHTPHPTPKESEIVHRLWLRFSDQLGSQELHHHDVVHFALSEIERELAEGKQDEVLERLKEHLQEIQLRRKLH
ncbi:MAG TPA: APC family permease [Terriglobales bacterium]|nr:APC family permease [Terriglobales bacterium]